LLKSMISALETGLGRTSPHSLSWWTREKRQQFLLKVSLQCSLQ
jgi:hypothetical protein